MPPPRTPKLTVQKSTDVLPPAAILVLLTLKGGRKVGQTPAP